MAMTQAILAFNAGSSSIKFAAYEVDAAHSKLALICKGVLDRRGEDAGFVIRGATGKIIENSSSVAAKMS